MGPARVHRRSSAPRTARYSQNHERSRGSAPGATLQQAQARLDALNVGDLERAGPLKSALINAGYHTRVVPFDADMVRNVRAALQLLWGGVLFVVLIAAVNITNLSLVRASGRLKELATRNALGAARGRVARQLVTETTLLTVIGGGLGLLRRLLEPRRAGDGWACRICRARTRSGWTARCWPSRSAWRGCSASSSASRRPCSSRAST